jgi:hypothetical protein
MKCADPKQISKLTPWIKTLESIESKIQVDGYLAKIALATLAVRWSNAGNDVLARLDAFLSHLRNHTETYFITLRESKIFQRDKIYSQPTANSAMHKECVSWMLSFSHHTKKNADPIEQAEPLKNKIVKFHEDLCTVNIQDEKAQPRYKV